MSFQSLAAMLPGKLFTVAEAEDQRVVVACKKCGKKWELRGLLETGVIIDQLEAHARACDRRLR